jgi:hypothetical protein
MTWYCPATTVKSPLMPPQKLLRLNPNKLILHPCHHKKHNQKSSATSTASPYLLLISKFSTASSVLPYAVMHP